MCSVTSAQRNSSYFIFPVSHRSLFSSLFVLPFIAANWHETQILQFIYITWFRITCSEFDRNNKQEWRNRSRNREMMIVVTGKRKCYLILNKMKLIYFHSIDRYNKKIEVQSMLSVSHCLYFYAELWWNAMEIDSIGRFWNKSLLWRTVLVEGIGWKAERCNGIWNV